MSHLFLELWPPKIINKVRIFFYYLPPATMLIRAHKIGLSSNVFLIRKSLHGNGKSCLLYRLLFHGEKRSTE